MTSALVVKLRGDLICGLPLTQTRQVLELEAARILPIPEMPDLVLGVCRFQEKVLWIVDPAFVVAGVTLAERFRVVVLSLEAQSVAVVIEALVDIGAALSPEIPAALRPFGCDRGEGWLLDAETILAQVQQLVPA